MAWICPSQHSAHYPRQPASLPPRHSTRFCRRLLCTATMASVAIPLPIPSAPPFSTPYSTTLGSATPIPASQHHRITDLVFNDAQPPRSTHRLSSPFIQSPTKEQQQGAAHYRRSKCSSRRGSSLQSTLARARRIACSKNQKPVRLPSARPISLIPHSNA